MNEPIIGDSDIRSTDELIAAALAEDDDEKYYELVGVLKYRGTRETFEAVRLATQSDDPDTRILGADILSEFGLPERVFPEEAISVLLALLERETDDDVIEEICIAFGRNPRAGVVEPLVRFKAHPKADIRNAVVFGLLTQEDDLAVRTLIDLSSDPDADVRNWATFGLGQQIDRDIPEIREALARRLNDECDAVRGEALRGLTRRGDERAVEPLIRELLAIAEADEWWDYAFEAVENMPEGRVYPALMAAKESGVENKTLDRAIALCRTPLSGEAEDKPTKAHTGCPVCDLKRAFKKSDSWQFCWRCGWADDLNQRADPDSAEGMNERSLNQERERWKMRLEAGKHGSVEDEIR